MENVLWWGVLGVASTAGFGFGVPTGSSHLWPLVARSAVAHGEVVPALWDSAVPMTAWAIGSAIGELPPYIFADRFVGYIENTRIAGATRAVIDRLGPWGVFGLACWPSVAFDAAGVAAGIARMPPASFLLATLGGKLLKTPFQGAIVGAGALRLWDGGGETIPEHLGLYAAGFCIALTAVAAALPKSKKKKDD